MIINKLVKKSLFIPATVFLLAGSGCSTTVVRENIISTVNTGLGISIAENPKTELYEVKVGYIRSQYYSIPTGKTVKNDNEPNGGIANKQDLRSNNADKTPQVISGIRVKSDIEHLFLGVDISESFAVGDVAVMSPAAVAMFVADAESDGKAGSAASAVEAADTKTAQQTTRAKKIIAHVAPGDAFDPAKLKVLAQGTAKERDVNAKADTLTLDALKGLLTDKWKWSIDAFYKNLPDSEK